MLVSPIHLRVLATTLDMEGFQSEAALRACGLDAMMDGLDESNWIPLDLYDRLIRATLWHTQVPHFGLQAGASLANQRYGVLPALVMHMPYLRQGLEDVMRFAPLMLPQSEIALHEAGDTAKIVISPCITEGPSALFRIEFVASAILQMLRYAGAGNMNLTRLSFKHAAPAHAEEYARSFGTPALFDASENCLAFSRETLDKAIPWHDKVSYLEAKTKAELALSTLQRNVDLIQRVKNVLVDAFPIAPTIEEVADKLGLSARSLRRHLSSRGTSHTELLRECRQLMAEHLLADTGVSLKQIAGELGFSSVTSFHRAFKDWTGMTPLEWRDVRIQVSPN